MPTQTPIEPNDTTNNTSQSKLAEVIAPLHRVTTTSKILAAVVMIILPFAGFWVGYKIASEKVVEVPVVMQSEVSNVDDLSNSEIDDSLLRKFVDDVFGFSFQYPAKWGEVVISEYEGICKDGSAPCLERSYNFDNLVEARGNAKFLTVQKNGFSDNRGDRGAGWDSFAGNITDDYLTKCSTEASCKIITSNTNLQIAGYYSIIEMGENEEKYSYQIFKSDIGLGMIFSSAGFGPVVPGSESEFQDTVIKSLEFHER